jgi:hypothetical protein
MIGPQRIVRNVTSHEITISEAGIVIGVAESVDLLSSYTKEEISRFNSLLTYIVDVSLILNDGVKDYIDVGEALRVLSGYTAATPETADGKLILQASPRPLSPKTYTHWTGRGDDLVNTRRGLGEPLLIEVDSEEESKDINVHFLSDSQVYLRQAYVGWENAGWGNTFSAHIWSEPTLLVEMSNTPDSSFTVDLYHRIFPTAPGEGTHILAGHPVPVPMQDANHQPCGHWNLKQDLSGFDYVPDGTGLYDWFDISLKVNTFVNYFPCYKDNYQMVLLDSDDIELIAPGYYLQIHVLNPAHVDFKLWAILVTYREETM